MKLTIAIPTYNRSFFLDNNLKQLLKEYDDNFEIIDKIIPKTFDFIFIDSLHEPNHVEKVFYHY